MLTFEAARAIPIADIMDHIARQYPSGDKRAVLHHSTKKEDWYFSPFHSENTPSFKVDKKRNRYTDFSTSQKGYRSGIDLVIHHWKRDPADKEAQRDALQLLETINPNPEIKTVPDEPRDYSDRYKIKKRGPLRKCKKLVKIIADRGIHIDIAEQVLDHLVIQDTENPRAVQDCFACDNIKGGTEVFHPTWKNCIGPKAPSVYPQPDGSAHIVLHGNKQVGQAIEELPKSRAAIVFEGVTDYLTFLMMNQGEIEPETVYGYLDNDPAGQEAQLVLGDAVEAMGWELRTQNHVYEGWKDLNAWWAANTDKHYQYTGQRRPTMNGPRAGLRLG